MKAAVLILALALVGCAAKKETIKEVYIYRADSSAVKTTVLKSPPVLTEFTISSLCDSVTGKPRAFSQAVKVGGNSAGVIVDPHRNQARVFINLDSVERAAVERYKEKIRLSDRREASLVIRYKTPPWAWWLLGFNVLYFGVKFGVKNIVLPPWLSWLKIFF